MHAPASAVRIGYQILDAGYLADGLKKCQRVEMIEKHPRHRTEVLVRGGRAFHLVAVVEPSPGNLAGRGKLAQDEVQEQGVEKIVEHDVWEWLCSPTSA